MHLGFMDVIMKNHEKTVIVGSELWQENQGWALCFVVLVAGKPEKSRVERELLKQLAGPRPPLDVIQPERRA